MLQLPDGYIVRTEKPEESFIIYGDLNPKGFVSKDTAWRSRTSTTPGTD